MKLIRLDVLGLSIALAAWMNSCWLCPHGTEEASMCGAVGTAGGPLTPTARGTAYFVDEYVFAQDRKVVKIRVDGGYQYSAAISTLGPMLKVYIFGAPGDPSADELAHCENLICTVPDPPRTDPHWITPWLEGRWDGASAEYRVLVRYVYETTGTTGAGTYHADKILDLKTPFDSSKANKFTVEPDDSGYVYTPGDNSSTLQCSATFNGAQHMSLFNIDLAYDAPATEIKVYAWPSELGSVLPTPSTPYLVWTEPSPPPEGWHPTALPGYYNGTSPKYFMSVRTFFAGGTPNPAIKRGFFDGITGQQGEPLDLE